MKGSSQIKKLSEQLKNLLAFSQLLVATLYISLTAGSLQAHATACSSQLFDASAESQLLSQAAETLLVALPENPELLGAFVNSQKDFLFLGLTDFVLQDYATLTVSDLRDHFLQARSAAEKRGLHLPYLKNWNQALQLYHNRMLAKSLLAGTMEGRFTGWTRKGHRKELPAHLRQRFDLHINVGLIQINGVDFFWFVGESSSSGSSSIAVLNSSQEWWYVRLPHVNTHQIEFEASPQGEFLGSSLSNFLSTL